MKKAKKILAIIVTGLIIFAIGFGGGYWFCIQKAAEPKIADDAEQKPESLDEKEKRIVTVDEVKVKLDEIRELSTYSGTYSIKKGYDQSRYILDGIRIPGTTNNVTLECEGIRMHP